MDNIKNLATNISNRLNNEKQQNNNIQDMDEMTHLKSKQNNKQSNGKSLFEELQSFKDDLGSKVEVAVLSAKEEIKNDLSKMDDKIKGQFVSIKSKLNSWFREKLTSSLLKLIEELRPQIKKSLKDPDMFIFIQNWVDDIVDELWPEIIEEVQYALMLEFNEPYVEISSAQTFCLFLPFVKIRHWYLYSTQPYDKTIWKRIKTFSYWIWFLISLVPYYGVSSYFYVLDFLMRDHSDEFQLVDFILSFKCMYFVTQGVEKSLIGYFMLFNCATMVDNQNSNKCQYASPGASIQVLTELIGFFCQIFFIYIAFIFLSFSKSKGKPKFVYNDKKIEQQSCCNKGGRIKYFMVWDFLALGVSVGLFYLVYLIQQAPAYENSGNYIFFAEVCYGLLSFPFILFNIPFVKDRLTKSKPTAYDRRGNCIPKIKNIKLINESKVEFKRQNLMDSIVIDVSEVIDF